MNKTIKSFKKNLFGIVFWVAMVTIFLFVSSFLVIRASGYAYNFKTQKFQKTGLIYLRTIPSGAEVYLDGKIISKRTPLRISYLIPGTYSIEVKKDGYQNISKNLRVYEALVSEYRNLLLFKDKVEPSSLSDELTEEFILSPGKTKILLKDTKGFKIVDFKRQTVAEPIIFSNMQFSAPIEFLDWPNSSYVLAKSENQFLLFDLSKKEIIDLSKYFSEIEKIEVTSKSRAIVKSAGKLYEFNLNQLKKSLIAENVGDFTTQGQSIYYLEASSGKTELISLTTLRRSKLFSSSQLSLQNKIYLSPDKQIAFYDISDKKLYYLDSKNGDKNLRLISTDVEDLVWSPTRETFNFREKYKLLFSRGNEIWLFQKGAKTTSGDLEEKKIITRVDKKVQTVGFFKYSNYFYYQVDGIVYVLDEDGMSYETIKTPSLSFDFGKDFKQLFYLDSSGSLAVVELR